MVRVHPGAPRAVSSTVECCAYTAAIWVQLLYRLPLPMRYASGEAPAPSPQRDGFDPHTHHQTAPVVQLDRAPDYESGTVEVRVLSGAPIHARIAQWIERSASTRQIRVRFLVRAPGSVVKWTSRQSPNLQIRVRLSAGPPTPRG